MNQENLLRLLRLVILANEVPDRSAILRFSDADGEHSGKSGWSFGESQFDIANNPTAAVCLRACGFSAEEIAGLKAQAIDVAPLNKKLQANAAIVKKFDDIQVSSCLKRAQAILERRGIVPQDPAARLAVADYHNQYYLSDLDQPGTLVHFLQGLKRPFTAEDVLKFKLEQTTYGKKRPKDCQRRYDNLVRIVNG